MGRSRRPGCCEDDLNDAAGPRAPHSVSVAGVVVDDHGRVLVIERRDDGRWEPPGGVLERAETPQDGARREVREETGVEVEVEHLTGVYKNMARGVIALVFRCRPVAGRPGPSDEAAAVAWRSLDEVVRDMTPAFAIRVTDAFRAEVAVRSHDGTDLVDAAST